MSLDTMAEPSGVGAKRSLRIRQLSDLHFEFHADGGVEFVSRLEPEGCDVLVLAGDIGNASCIYQSLCCLAGRFAPRPVLFVEGNHEFYGHIRRPQVVERIRQACTLHPNLVRLSRGAVFEQAGVRILGCSLWFARDDRAPRHHLNDFRQIPGFEEWVYAEGEADAEFLRREVGPSDVVVTHYLPCEEAVAAKYKGDPLNAFFMRDMRALILERRPAFWLFGHTHETVDTRVEGTRLRCNPFGYAGYEENPTFDPGLTLEVHG